MYTAKVLKTMSAPGLFVSDKHPCPALLFAAPPRVALHSANGAPDEGMDIGAHSGPGVNGANGTNGTAHLGSSAVAAPSTSRPDAWIVTGSENGKTVVFDLGSKQVVQVLEQDGPHGTSPVVALAVSPDGRTIATGSLEPGKIIHIWQDAS